MYFSIITQALTVAAMLLFFRNETGFGGNNGFTGFQTIAGLPLATPSMRMALFMTTALALLGFFLLACWLVQSKYGRVLQAIRDAESRVMLSGYSPLPYKLSIWVISAMMCGVAGMTDEETARTAELFLHLKGRHSLMVVEHDMHFIRTLAGDTGTVTVLAEGRVLAQGTLDAVQADERVIESYLGR